MNYLPRKLHDDVCFRLMRGDSIREIVRATGVCKGTIQIRKNMLVAEGWRWERLPGGKVRNQTSIIHFWRMSAVRERYAKKKAASLSTSGPAL